MKFQPSPFGMGIEDYPDGTQRPDQCPSCWQYRIVTTSAAREVECDRCQATRQLLGTELFQRLIGLLPYVPQDLGELMTRNPDPQAAFKVDLVRLLCEILCRIERVPQCGSDSSSGSSG